MFNVSAPILSQPPRAVRICSRLIWEKEMTRMQEALNAPRVDVNVAGGTGTTAKEGGGPAGGSSPKRGDDPRKMRAFAG